MTGRDEKMAPRITETMRLFTALLLIAAISRGQTENVYLSSGRDVTLSPNYRGDFNEIIWLVNDIKLVELELNEKQQPIYYKTFPRLNAGAFLNNQTGELTIPQLTIRDSGKYKAEVKLHDLTYNYTYITLTVLDPVVTPIITIHTTKDWIELGCESTSPGVTYKWWDDKGVIVSNDKTYIVNILDKLTLTCIASNVVSEGRASVELPGGLSGGDIAWIIAGILVLIVVIIWIFECIRRKCRTYSLVKAINKRCNPFPYCRCCIRALRVGQPSSLLDLRDEEYTRNNDTRLNKVKDPPKTCSQCIHDPQCIRAEEYKRFHRARPKTAEGRSQNSQLNKNKHNVDIVEPPLLEGLNSLQV